MSNGYTEGEKMMFASFVNMEVAAMVAENEINKANNRAPKYDERDFMKAVEYANMRMRENW